jgi:hypothetical protein
MGLDTSHDCWHGAYSAFRRWRNYVAQVGGFTMVDGERGPDYELPWDEIPITNDNLMGHWSKPLPDGADPLIYLLAHSDCDGVIHPTQGREIAKRLREVLPNMKDEGHSGGHIPSMRDVTERFITGLEEAADAGEDVDFH